MENRQLGSVATLYNSRAAYTHTGRCGAHSVAQPTHIQDDVVHIQSRSLHTYRTMWCTFSSCLVRSHIFSLCHHGWSLFHVLQICTDRALPNQIYECIHQHTMNHVVDACLLTEFEVGLQYQLVMLMIR